LFPLSALIEEGFETRLPQIIEQAMADRLRN
jgi:hypothetical protein